MDKNVGCLIGGNADLHASRMPLCVAIKMKAEDARSVPPMRMLILMAKTMMILVMFGGGGEQFSEFQLCVVA